MHISIQSPLIMMESDIILDEHLQKQNVGWDPSACRITIKNIDEKNTYQLITNSLKLSKIVANIEKKACQFCKHQISDLSFDLKNQDITTDDLQEEIQSFKYCVISFDKITLSFKEVVGSYGLLNQIKNSLITQNLVLTSEMHIKQQQEEVDRFLINSMTLDNRLAKSHIQTTHTEEMDCSVVFSIHNQCNQMVQFSIFVTKLQKYVEIIYQNKMFYQYAWNQKEIEYTMKKIKNVFGEFHSIIQKRRFLKFNFRRNKNDQYFKGKYQSIKKQLILSQNKISQGNVINYYVMSTTELLPNQQQTSKLFLLPNNEVIVDFEILSPWIIIAAQKYVMFIHNYRPMEYFKHEQSLVPTKIVKHPSEHNIVIIVDKRGSLFYYKLGETTSTLIAVYYVPFVVPYSLILLKDTFVIAGIDIQQKVGKFENIKACNRNLFFVHPNKKSSNSKNKLLIYDSKLQIVKVSKKQLQLPITHLIATSEKQIVACAWNNRFYLVSITGYKLVEVELKYRIEHAFQVPFLFNKLNFMLVIADGQIIRVGVQSYGEGLGTELSRLNQQQTKDCSLVLLEKSRCQIFTCTGRKISKFSYLTEQKKQILIEPQGKLIKIASDRQGIAYLVDLQHSIQVKYLEF